MAQKYIKIGDLIPNVYYRIKVGARNADVSTQQQFAGKKIIIFSVPCPFFAEYPSRMAIGYEENIAELKSFGIDEIYCTSTTDYFTLMAWLKSQNITQVLPFPDGNSQWATQIGFLVDNSEEYLGYRTHRYCMIIDDCRVKKVFYENFTHDMHTCFTETNAEKICQYLSQAENTWEQFQKG